MSTIHAYTSIYRGVLCLLAFTRQLVRLLKDETTSSETLEVAAYDLGEYVRYYPRGKGYVYHITRLKTIQT